MRKLALALGWTLVAAVVSPRALSQPADLRTLFPSQADIFVDNSPLSRLELPPDVIAACRPDLSDLRIVDAAGKEVPYLIDSRKAIETEVEVEQRITPELLDVKRRTIERPTGPPLRRETYELSPSAERSQTGTWDLVIQSRRSSFVRRVEVSAVGEDGSSAKLVENGSVFRLRNPGREKTRLSVPDRAGDRFVVTLEGEDGFFLEPAFRLETSHTVLRERAVVELSEISRQELDRKTIVELARPRGLVPDLVQLSTATRSFNRALEVRDEGPGGSDSAVGRGLVFRFPALATVEGLEVQVSAARGDRLRVEIDNGDSPALEDLVFRAVVRRPALLFTIEGRGAAEPSGTVFFGGGRAYRPRYDLQRQWSSLPGGQGAAGGESEQLYASARLGDVSANPRFDASPILAFAMRPGAEIEAGGYTHRRELRAKPSDEGLIRVQLGLEDLAHTREDLADLRIIDGESRQRAYLLEHRAGNSRMELKVSDPESQDGQSAYEITLPAAPAKIDELPLETSLPFFDRAYSLVAKRQSEKGEELVPLAQGRLVRRAGEMRLLRIPIQTGRIDSLELIVEDGNDAPLTFDRIEGGFPFPAAYFVAPEGDYSLLVGNPEATAPTYELERVRSIVLAVKSSDASADPLIENPSFSAAARLGTQAGAQQALLWVALGLAVAVLAGLTLKLARREQPSA